MMRGKLHIFLIFSLFWSAVLVAREVWIVVPGTYSADYDWYQPEGEFFQALKKGLTSPDSSLVSFRWSGGITANERLRGAKMLKELVQSYPDDTEINVVAHSHGGNVSLLCTQLMGRNKVSSRKINTLFLLGTPIHKKKYNPDYQMVDHVINLFSFNDDVQPVFSWFERELSEHPKCANLRLFLNGVAPTHISIHAPTIARWLPALGKNITFPAPHEPQCVYISEGEPPRIAHDHFCRILQKEDVENHNGYWYHLGSFKRNLMEWFEISPDMFSMGIFKKMMNNLHLACAYGAKSVWQKVRNTIRFS